MTKDASLSEAAVDVFDDVPDGNSAGAVGFLTLFATVDIQFCNASESVLSETATEPADLVSLIPKPQEKL